MQVSGQTLIAWLYTAVAIIATAITAAVGISLMWFVTNLFFIRRSRAKLRLLVKNDTASYLTKRVTDLRFYSHRVASHIQWRVSANEPALDLEKFLRERQYPAEQYPAIIDSIKRLGDEDTRSLSLEGLICQLLIANTSLGGSPVWTMLNPLYIAFANVVLGESPNPFRIWIWEKSRLYLMNILEPRYTRSRNIIADLDEKPPSKEAIATMKVFIEELLSDWIDFDDFAWETFDVLCCLTVRVGLAMQNDLSPWRWSFEYGGVAENKIVVYPALLAEGDEFGRRYDSPKIVVPAVGCVPPTHDGLK